MPKIQLSVLNAFVDGILVLTDEGKIDFCNDQFIQLWNVPDSVLGSKSIDQLLLFLTSKIDHSDSFILNFHINANEKNFHEILLADGRTFKSYSTPMIDDNSKSLGRVLFFSDITKQKEFEEKIQYQQKIITRSARMSALGEMAGGIAHEINNPLSIILAHAELLADVTGENLSANLVHKTAEKINDTSKRISHIVNGLRIFSRNSDKDPLVPVILENAIQDTIAICVERFKTNSIRIDFEKTEKDLRVEGRASQLMQVFLNLLNNATDAIYKLEEKWIKISLKKNFDMIEVSVVDSGNGIDHSIIEKIFQPFFTTKSPGKGTGLGLSISRGIIEEHGGRLSLDKNSRHTCFIIQLPLYQLKQPKPLQQTQIKGLKKGSQDG